MGELGQKGEVGEKGMMGGLVSCCCVVVKLFTIAVDDRVIKGTMGRRV